MSTPYIVSARKYRPSTFRSVVGQPSLTLTLKNAIESDRLAQAYLFCGPRGVGKTSCARIFAKTINCEHRTPEGEACNECESCRAFNEGRSINVVELDAASNNSVDNIRTLNDQVRVPPQSGRYRVFIIDEVHMLSVGAFNAFLKTLEEPPSYVIFILATTEKHKVLPTILSRCQIYDFNRIGVNDIASHLSYVAEQEGITAEPSALGVIARKADGAMRDALSIFDQVAASCRGNITYQGTIENLNVLDYEFYFKLVDAFLQCDVPEALLIYKQVRDKGFDSQSFVNGLANHLRELMVAATEQTLPLLEVSADVAERYKAQASQIKPRWAYAAMEAVNFCDLNYRTSGNKQFLVELTLIRLCQLADPTGATDSKGTPSRTALRQPSPTATPAQTAAPQPTTAATAHAPQQLKPSPTQPAHKVVTAPPARPSNSVHAVKAKPQLMKISVNSASAAEPEPEYKIAPQQQPIQTTSQPTIAATAVSISSLHEAWQTFITANPTLQLLASAMRTNRPMATENPSHFIVKVETPAQQEQFEDAMGALMPFLRQHTGSDALTLSIEVDAAIERPKVLTRREAFEQMLEQHPQMRDMLEELNATMID